MSLYGDHGRSAKLRGGRSGEAWCGGGSGRVRQDRPRGATFRSSAMVVAARSSASWRARTLEKTESKRWNVARPLLSPCSATVLSAMRIELERGVEVVDAAAGVAVDLDQRRRDRFADRDLEAVGRVQRLARRRRSPGRSSRCACAGRRGPGWARSRAWRASRCSRAAAEDRRSRRAGGIRNRRSRPRSKRAAAHARRNAEISRSAAHADIARPPVSRPHPTTFTILCGTTMTFLTGRPSRAAAPAQASRPQPRFHQNRPFAQS